MSFTRQGRLESGETILHAARMGDPDYQMEYSANAAHERLFALDVELAEINSDPLELTVSYLTQKVGDEVFAIDGNRVVPSALLRSSVADLEHLANSHYRTVLLDAPTLRLQVEVGGLSPVVQWRSPLGDELFDEFDEYLGLDDLSTAQRKWALWAISTAAHDLLPTDVPTVVTIIDEPEAALHRSAEAHRVSALERISSRDGSAVLVATHSPDLLNSSRANVMEVRRDGIQSRLATLGAAQRESLRSLGLTPSDLLRRQRAFLLVEGQHDLEVLRVLLGDELSRLRVQLLPLRGATQLSPTISRFLFEFTSAHHFVMLDNLRTDKVSVAWRQARENVLAHEIDAAKAVLKEAFPGGDIESKVLREFLEYAIDDDASDRVTPFGLSLGDIIEYLPVTALLPRAKPSWTWEKLRVDHEEAKVASAKFKVFKSWLAKVHGADFSDDAIIAAASAMDEIPPDFVRLLKTIEAVTDAAG